MSHQLTKSEIIHNRDSKSILEMLTKIMNTKYAAEYAKTQDQGMTTLCTCSFCRINCRNDYWPKKTTCKFIIVQTLNLMCDTYYSHTHVVHM